MGKMRGDNRTDPIATQVMVEPGVQAVAEATRERSYDRMQNAVAEAIQNTDGRKLKGWVAVAMWEDADGNEEHTLLADDSSTPLELKAYLHDGIWSAAHAE